MADKPEKRARAEIERPLKAGGWGVLPWNSMHVLGFPGVYVGMFVMTRSPSKGQW